MSVCKILRRLLYDRDRQSRSWNLAGYYHNIQVVVCVFFFFFLCYPPREVNELSCFNPVHQVPRAVKCHNMH